MISANSVMRHCEDASDREMKMEAKHTELPWAIGRYGEVFQQGDKFKDRIVLTGFALNSGHARPEAEANTEFIVRAANAHDELVAALDEFTRLAETDVLRTTNEGRELLMAALTAANAALAKASLANNG